MKLKFKKLGFLLYDHVQPMDVIAPWEVLAAWKNILNAPLDMFMIAETDKIVQCASQIRLKADTCIEKSPPLDYLIVPGGIGRHQAIHNSNLLQFIKNQAENCTYVLSVCTGMFLLYHAGLLEGKTVTTYWRAIPELRQLTDVTLKELRVVRDGKIWTAGGVTSGIDLAFKLIENIAGKSVAGQVQLLMEYFPEDFLYCSEQTTETLPPYYSDDKDKPVAHLPEYISNYMANQ